MAVMAFSAAAVASVAPAAGSADFASVQGLFAAAGVGDQQKFSAGTGAQFGMFVSDDFVVPMKFDDFKQFAAMCRSPEYVSTNDEALMKGVKAVSVGLACTAPKATAAVARNFDFLVAGGKVVAIRPEGLN